MFVREPTCPRGTAKPLDSYLASTGCHFPYNYTHCNPKDDVKCATKERTKQYGSEPKTLVPTKKVYHFQSPRCVIKTHHTRTNQTKGISEPMIGSNDGAKAHWHAHVTRNRQPTKRLQPIPEGVLSVTSGDSLPPLQFIRDLSKSRAAPIRCCGSPGRSGAMSVPFVKAIGSANGRRPLALHALWPSFAVWFPSLVCHAAAAYSSRIISLLGVAPFKLYSAPTCGLGRLPLASPKGTPMSCPMM